MLLASASLYAASLSNGKLTAEFGERGLTSLAGYRLTDDSFSITLDGKTFDSGALAIPKQKAGSGQFTFTYSAGLYQFKVVYELRPDWQFLSKQVVVEAPRGATFHVNDIAVLRESLAEAPSDVHVIHRARPKLGTADYGAAIRFNSGRGLLAVVQNPFLTFEGERGRFSLRYRPDMLWDASWGSFESDRALLAPCHLSGHRLLEKMIPEWKLQAEDKSTGLDEAEVDTFTGLVRAFLL